MKSKLTALLLVLTVMCTSGIISCKKTSLSEVVEDTHVDSTTLIKVLSWLDLQKDSLGVKGKKSIDSLKANLVASQIRKESIGLDKRIVIIPLNDSFKTANITTQKTFKNLVLLENENQQVYSGKIVEVIPSNKQIEKLPIDLISKVYKKESISVDGLISILSITNSYKGEIEYKNGNLAQIRIAKTKSRKNNLGAGNKVLGNYRVNGCIDWYWEYYINGVLVYEEYAFTTCSGGEECQATRHIGSNTPFKLTCV